VPRRRRGARPREVWVSGERRRLLLTRVAGGVGHYQTAKLDLGPGATAIEIGFDPEIQLPQGFEVEIWRWSAER
jgi:hypothetical protein